MRGKSSFVPGWRAPDESQGEDALYAIFDAEVELAMRNSLENVEENVDESGQDGEGEIDVGPDEPAAQSDPQERRCAVCLDEEPVMLTRPCNHVATCERCSRRLQNRPCVICRRAVESRERVFF